MFYSPTSEQDLKDYIQLQMSGMDNESKIPATLMIMAIQNFYEKEAK